MYDAKFEYTKYEMGIHEQCVGIEVIMTRNFKNTGATSVVGDLGCQTKQNKAKRI